MFQYVLWIKFHYQLTANIFMNMFSNSVLLYQLWLHQLLHCEKQKTTDPPECTRNDRTLCIWFHVLCNEFLQAFLPIFVCKLSISDLLAHIGIAFEGLAESEENCYEYILDAT